MGFFRGSLKPAASVLFVWSMLSKARRQYAKTLRRRYYWKFC